MQWQTGSGRWGAQTAEGAAEPTEAPKRDAADGFRFWRVLVTARRQEAGRDLISFRLCNAAAIFATEYTVDLTDDLHHVWPKAPSSAVKATPGELGFLLLTDRWAVAHGVSPREGGGKFPLPR